MQFLLNLWFNVLMFLGLQKPCPKKRTRKRPDTTKITQYHYDFIIRAHQEWKAFNKAHPKQRKSVDELVEVINGHLNMDKSHRALARIWRGEIDRHEVPVGKPIPINYR